jgi:hypothetical protein
LDQVSAYAPPLPPQILSQVTHDSE